MVLEGPFTNKMLPKTVDTRGAGDGGSPESCNRGEWQVPRSGDIRFKAGEF